MIVGGLVGLLLLFVLVLYVIGRGMDPNHLFSCTIRLKRKPEEVFRLIEEVQGWPSWDKGVGKVEMLPAVEGKQCCRMWVGRNPMELVTTRSEPPRLLERTIRDVGKMQMFSGSWLHEIAPEAGGCVLTLTERGTIHNALPRAMARKLADPAMYLKRHLKELAAKFGEEAKFD